MESEMKKIVIIAAALLLAATVNADAKTRHVVKHAANSGVTVYDHDSPNPNIGWHTDSTGMRACTQDCDNPEIPGSGAKCRNVNWMGMAARECVTGGDF
jgi:hypothetical protein